MPILAIILSFSLLCAQASLFQKTDQAKQKTSSIRKDLSEFTHVEKIFASSKNQYKVKADIIIPENQDELAVMLHYDELSDIGIKDLAWLSGKSSKTIPALRSESQINTQLEKILNKSNPSIAYDRLQSGKHIISKIFYFDKSKVFQSRKAETHKLKITWANDSVIFVAIENLYLNANPEPEASPKAPPATTRPSKPSPLARDSQGARVPSQAEMEDQLLRQQKLYEYEMLEIESTLNQMKSIESQEVELPSGF